MSTKPTIIPRFTGGPQPHRQTAVRPAFTIVELLAVIFIITIVLGITFPVISAFRDSSKTASGVTTVSTAVDVARAYATNRIQADLRDAATPITDATFSGTAALFTPAGQVRLVENDQLAVDQFGANVETGTFEAYADIPNLDFVTLTSGTGIVGVQRFAGGTTVNNLALLPPPFAIAFNEEGVMITEPNTIVYDSDGDQVYNTGIQRVSLGSYTPADWDRDAQDVQTLPNGDIKRELPFELIEVVTAVIVFDLDAFYDEFGRGAWSPTDTATGPSGLTRNQWIRDNGRPLIFSRTTGVAFQDEGDGN
ncbi:MAG: hypothetical protein AAGI68_13940 [Planctomycetota bacterium]